MEPNQSSAKRVWFGEVKQRHSGVLKDKISKRKMWISFWRYGGLAQLGERLPCKQEVTGSIPVLSTKRLTEAKKSESSYLFHWVSWKRAQAPFKAQRSGFEWKRRNKDTVEFWNWRFQNGNCGFDFDEDAPWKLNIVIIDAILWEGNSKEKLLIRVKKLKGNKYNFVLNFFYWVCIIQSRKTRKMDFSTRSS